MKKTKYKQKQKRSITYPKKNLNKTKPDKKKEKIRKNKSENKINLNEIESAANKKDIINEILNELEKDFTDIISEEEEQIIDIINTEKEIKKKERKKNIALRSQIIYLDSKEKDLSDNNNSSTKEEDNLIIKDQYENSNKDPDIYELKALKTKDDTIYNKINLNFYIY